MHEVVLSSLHNLLSAQRLPSFAGNGLPERMRSTTFALLGLMAAAGLSLVAIFSQSGLPLHSLAPLPSGPPEVTLSKGVALPDEHLAPSRRAAAPGAGTGIGLGGRSRRGQGQSPQGGDTGLDRAAPRVDQPNPAASAPGTSPSTQPASPPAPVAAPNAEPMSQSPPASSPSEEESAAPGHARPSSPGRSSAPGQVKKSATTSVTSPVPATAAAGPGTTPGAAPPSHSNAGGNGNGNSK
jgi:hypothetical protein